MTPVNTAAADIVFPGRNYGHLAFDQEGKTVVPVGTTIPLGEPSVGLGKRTKTNINPEHIRVRAYFMWHGKHKDFPAWTDVDYWLAAEKIERYFA